MIRLFSDVTIEQALKASLGQVDRAISVARIDNLLPYEVENLSQLLSQQHALNHLSVDVDNVVKSSSERDRLGREFPSIYSVQPHQSYPRVLVTYKYAISGRVELLSAKPRSRSIQLGSRYPTARIENNSLVLEYHTFHAYPLTDEQKTEVREIMLSVHYQIKDMVNAVNEDIDAYNNSLYDYVLDNLNKRIKAAKDKAEHDQSL